MTTFETFCSRASELDAVDPLAHLVERFVPNPELIYLDGNSLGRLPKATVSLMEDMVLHQWGDRLIRSWNEHWIELPQKIAAKIARLVGAGEDEIFLGDSTSVNLFKLAYGVLRYNNGRKLIISDEFNFPSDLYVLQGLAESLGQGHELRILPGIDGIHPDLPLLEQNVNQQTALVCLSHVTFRSAYLYDMAAINSLAQKAGTQIIWDLSHAVGSVEVNLKETGAQLAVGCTYKYLNGGPGAPAFLYVSREFQQQLFSPIWAWFGHANPFEFSQHYEPRKDVWKYAAGTPPILSIAAIEPGLDLLLESGMQSVRQKSLSLSGLFLEAYRQFLEPLGFSLASPENPRYRGSHVSLRHSEGYRICQALIHPMDGVKPIIPDFRNPDLIRFGFAPLYNTHTEVVTTIGRLADIVNHKIYLHFDKTRAAVT